MITTTDKTKFPNLHTAAPFTLSHDGSGGAQADLAVNCCTFFFFNDTATTEIYTLSLPDALPILSNTGTGNAYNTAASDPLPGGTVWSIDGPANGRSESPNSEPHAPPHLAGRLPP